MPNAFLDIDTVMDFGASSSQADGVRDLLVEERRNLPSSEKSAVGRTEAVEGGEVIDADVALVGKGAEGVVVEYQGVLGAEAASG